MSHEYTNTVYERLRSNIKFINTKKSVTPSVAVITLLMHYPKVNFNRILKVSNNFLSEKDVT